MKEKNFLREFGNIDERFVVEAGARMESKGKKKFVKWLSVAAGICVIIAIGVSISNSTSKLEKGYEAMTENGVAEKVPELGSEYMDYDTFQYYIYTEDGDYRIVTEKLNGVRLDDVIEKYFWLNNVSDIELDKLLHTKSAAKEWQEEGVIMYEPANNTNMVYLQGGELSDDIAIGLVNTVISYVQNQAGNDYVKLYMNNAELFINAERTDYGYAGIKVDVEGDDEGWAEDFEETVDISFVIKDDNGKTMKNIAYHLEYISGEKGSYQPGYGITDSSGEFTRKVHPDATYIMYLQKRNAVSYTKEFEAVVYEEMAVRLEVTEAFAKEIVWDEEKVSVIEEKDKYVTIDISDVYDGNCEEIFLQLFTEDGGQIQLGYPENNGEFMWYDGQEGEYYLSLQKFEEKNGDTDIIYTKSYVVKVEDGKMNIIREHNADNPIPE